VVPIGLPWLPIPRHFCRLALQMNHGSKGRCRS
jgi:hypothetical protein